MLFSAERTLTKSVYLTVASFPATMLVSDEQTTLGDKKVLSVPERLQKFQSISSPWMLKSKYNSSFSHFQAMVKEKKEKR